MLPLNYIGLLSALTSISVHAIALDRRAISDPDLLIRYPWPVNWNQTHPNPDPNRVLLHRSPLINAFKPRNTTNLNHKRTPTPSSDPSNIAPTPAPTAPGSDLTTVHITSQSDFALLLPKTSGEKISDAEADGVAYCSGSGCANTFPEGFITGSAVKSADDGSWIQVCLWSRSRSHSFTSNAHPRVSQITGCLNPSLFPFAKGDDGGQFDVRFPNGAQCTFGGYGASFIELYVYISLASIT